MQDMVSGMSTDARTLANHYYAESDRCLAVDLAVLGEHPQGVVLYMPQLVVLMKPVQRAHPDDWENLSTIFPAADAWYIHLLAGDLSMARRMAAELQPMRWLCFRRGLRHHRAHCLPWSAVIRMQQPAYH